MINLKRKMTNLFSQLQDGVYAVNTAYKKKGLGNLKIPLLMIVLCPVAVWIFLYKPSLNSYNKKLAVLSSIEARQKYGMDFEQLQEKIVQKEARFVDSKDKSDWLSKVIRETCEKENIKINSIQQQREISLEDHYIKASVDFKFSSNFNQLVKVIERLENNPYLIKIARIEINKSPGPGDLARVAVTVTVEAIFAKKKLAEKL